MKNKGDVLSSMLNNYNDCNIFLHNTREKGIVDNILNYGFRFESQLSHSTDRINPHEPIEVTYFLFQRKDYGYFTIIIAIPKKIFEIYSRFSCDNDVAIEEVLSITNPYYGDNDELIFTLSPKHVLGYFNIKTGEFVENKNWDPMYNNSITKSFLRNRLSPDIQQDQIVSD